MSSQSPASSRQELPLACTLDAAGQAERAEEIRELCDRSLLGRRVEKELLELRFRPDAEAQVRDLVARERECCAFLDFEIEQGDELTLRVRGAIEAWGLGTRD